MTCNNCGNPSVTRQYTREFRYRPYALPWVWMACDECVGEDAPRWSVKEERDTAATTLRHS